LGKMDRGRLAYLKRSILMLLGKACGNGVLKGFKELKKEDIKNIYEMCL
jgi:hypothetical protein